VALEGEPKPPTEGEGTVRPVLFAGGRGRALDRGGFASSRAFLFSFSGCVGRVPDGLVGTVAVGGGWVSVRGGEVSVVVVGGGGSSGVTHS
jgi:hypothetical protein